MIKIPVALLFLILFTSMIFSAAANEEDTFFDLLNSSVWDGVWDSLTHTTKPDKHIQTGVDLQGWIDIVGYRNMIRINSVDYIYGDPADCAIIEFDVWDLMTGQKDRLNDNVDWIHTNLTVLQDKGNITAVLDIEMLWHHSELKHTLTGKPYIKKTYHTESMSINDIEKVPKTFDYTPAEMTAYITVYNSSFSPKVLVYVPELPYLLKTTYTYNTDTIIRSGMLGEVEQTEKGIEFVNLTDVMMWSDPEGDLCHIGSSAVIRCENFSVDQLNINVSTPYETVKIKNYNVTTVDYTPGTSVHPLLYHILAIFIILISVFLYNIRQIGR
jgi:hypothetical protein